MGMATLVIRHENFKQEKHEFMGVHDKTWKTIVIWPLSKECQLFDIQTFKPNVLLTH